MGLTYTSVALVFHTFVNIQMPMLEMEPTMLDATKVSVVGRHFVDAHGRILDLRGANVSSSSKVYVPRAFASAQSMYQELII